MDAVWEEVFALMWEAYRAGTIPVGAVVADERGEIVSRGRNRIHDTPHDGQLAGTRLAHAEVNALVSLSSAQTYEQLVLYSALEPCHLCLSAAISARVGAVRYAASDPYGGGVGKLLPSPDHDRHPVAIEGPLQGPGPASPPPSTSRTSSGGSPRATWSRSTPSCTPTSSRTRGPSRRPTPTPRSPTHSPRFASSFQSS